MTDWTELLPKNACEGAVDWARTQPDLATAWTVCERGDWMLWLAGDWSGPPESASRKTLVLAACACARLALPHVRSDEERPLRAIDTAERWTRGEAGVTLADVRTAAADANAAAAADAAVAANANDAAANANDAAANAAYAVAALAANAAYDAANAAYDAAAAAYAAADTYDDAAIARRATLAQCADIVRRFYPKPPIPQ